MLVIVDKRSPQKTIENLKKLFQDVFLFESSGITYNSISCHPDIFIYYDNNNIIISPNSPKPLINKLENSNINYVFGYNSINEVLTKSVLYNCVSNNKYLIHKNGYTDKKILELNETKFFISVPQAFTRCSLLSLDEKNYITSDLGIKKVFETLSLNCFYFEPSQIKIIDHKNGLFGGTCGIYNNTIYFNGNILLHKDGKNIEKLIESLGFNIVCLNNDYLYDGGGILFLENN